MHICLRCGCFSNWVLPAHQSCTSSGDSFGNCARSRDLWRQRWRRKRRLTVRLLPAVTGNRSTVETLSVVSTDAASLPSPSSKCSHVRDEFRANHSALLETSVGERRSSCVTGPCWLAAFKLSGFAGIPWNVAACTESSSQDELAANISKNYQQPPKYLELANS